MASPVSDATYELRPTSPRWTHIALPCQDIDASIAWYERYTPLKLLDRRDDIDFETEVNAKLASEVANVANFPKFEFMRLVLGVPGAALTPPPPPNFFPGWVFSDMFFATEARAEVERSPR